MPLADGIKSDRFQTDALKHGDSNLWEWLTENNTNVLYNRDCLHGQ